MNGEFFNNKQIRGLGGLVLLMLTIALASYAVLNFEKMSFLNPMPATVSVMGEGEVLAVPDVGQFSFSVMASGKDAAEAQQLSGTKINDIYDYLKEQGIEEKDIKNQSYTLYPKWRYDQRPCPIGSFCPGEQVQDGFELSQSISVKIRNTEKSGELIAGVGERGATDISGLEFTVDDTEKVKAEAREKAIEDAKAKAEVLAEKLGVKIVRLTSYYEEGGYYEPYYYDAKISSVEGMGGDFGGAVMPVGEESTKVRVNVTYEVR